MLKLGYLLEEYRQRVNNDMLYSVIFKKLVKKYLQIDPLYRAQFQEILTWEKFLHDVGTASAIDLVAKHLDGSYFAIQCQCNEVDYGFRKADLQAFLSSVKKDVYSGAIIFTTTNNDIGCVYDITKEVGKPVSVVSVSNLENADIDWQVILKNIYKRLNNYLMNNTEIDLYDFKNQANKKKNINVNTDLERNIEIFSETTEGELTIPFKSHKDSLDIMEKVLPKQGKALFFLQSIKQLNEVLSEYKKRKRDSLQHLIVHIDEDALLSDTKEGEAKTKVAEVEDIFEDIPGKTVLEMTKYEDLGREIEFVAKRHKKDNKGIVVFANYNAMKSIKEAQRRGLSDFDLIVSNESDSGKNGYYHSQNTPYTNSAHVSRQKIKEIGTKKRLHIKSKGHPDLRPSTRLKSSSGKEVKKLSKLVSWVSKLLHL